MLDSIGNFFGGLFGPGPTDAQYLQRFVSPDVVNQLPQDQLSAFKDQARQSGLYAAAMGQDPFAAGRNAIASNMQMAQAIQNMNMANQLDGQVQQQVTNMMSPTVTQTGALEPNGMRVGPTAQRAAMIGQAKEAVPKLKAYAQAYREAAAKVGIKNPDVAKKYTALADDYEQRAEYAANVRVKGDDGNEYQRVIMKDGSTMDVGMAGDPDSIRKLRAMQADPSLMQTAMDLGRASATNVNLNTGQKGFENTTALRKEFEGSATAQAYKDMRGSYEKITGLLAKPSAANDLAAATSFMKLLDPGSVVRESELAMAMNATGVLDKFMNTSERIMKGLVLTPDQRADFQRSAQILFDAAEKRYMETQKQYGQIAASIGVDPRMVVGDLITSKAVGNAMDDPLGLR